MNPLQQVALEKVTFNVGVGEGGQALENAKLLLQRISGRTPVITKARVRNPTFKIKQGDPIGVKVTVRGSEAAELLKRSLDAVDFVVSPKSFDNDGNVSFGVREYIDFPGVQYDPKIGMIGFDVCVTLKKAGKRIALRRLKKSRVGSKQRVSRTEAQKFLQEKFGLKFAEEA